MPRDPYEVLGLTKSATADEIQKSYRKLARKFHPDRNPGDKKAEAEFKDVQAAYEILSDETKKQNFDRFGHAGPLASRPAMDPVIQAYTGLVLDNVGEDGIPRRVPYFTRSPHPMRVAPSNTTAAVWVHTLSAIES